MLESERLLYRPLDPTDTDAVYALTGDPAVARYMRFDTHTDRRQAAALIDDYTLPGNAAFLIRDKDGGGTVGVFALKQDAAPHIYALSAFLAPDCWHAGYASEATACLCAYAFTALQAQALEAYVVGSHGASCRVLEKTGFRLAETKRIDGLPEGLRIYRLTHEEGTGEATP